MSTITTDLPFGSITVINSIKVSGTSPLPGQTAIDTNKAKLIRIGDKAIITMPIAFDDDDVITIQLGTQIIPTGGQILSLATDLPNNSDNIDVHAEVSSSNEILVNRDPSVNGITAVSITMISEGYDNIGIERSSNLPFELDNATLDNFIYASDIILSAEFTGLQRNDDRTLCQFYASTILQDATHFRISLFRVLNGGTTFKSLSKLLTEITVVDGTYEVEFTGVDVSNLGLTSIKLTVSENYAKIGTSGLTIDQTLFDSQHIFKNEVEVGLKREIVALPTEIMGGLEDVSGFNFKDIFKQFSLTSEYNALPPDNYVRGNYFELSRTNNTVYMSFRIYDVNDVLIREISGSGPMTVPITDYTDVSQDYSIDGWRLRWNADFDVIDSNLIISPLTKENCSFKIPAENVERTDNFFDENFNTLGNTVNKTNFDISRFVKNIRLVPNNKEFLVANGEIKDFRIMYFEVSATRYYISFNIGGTEYTLVEEPRNVNVGIFDVEFVYPDFKVVITADWNSISNYSFNYNALGNGSATLKKQVVLDAYTEALANEGATGITLNDRYNFGASTDRMLPYLWKDIGWGQSSKIPRTNFVSLTDHNDEAQAMTKVLSWVKSDSAIEKAVPCAIMQGDFITTFAITSAQDFADKIDAWFDAVPNDLPILWCNGNHDLGLDGLTSFALAPTANTRRTLIHDRLYNRLPQNYKDNFVWGSATDAMYYYCDVPDTNVRVIAIDQFEYPLVAGAGRPIKYSGTAIYDNQVVVAGFNVYYSEDQLNFLINALDTTPDTSTAIVLTHIPIGPVSDQDGEKNALGNSNIALRQLLRSFKNKTSETVNVDAIDEIPAFSVNTTFNGRTESKILLLKGHLHQFYHNLLDNSDINYIQNMAIGNTSPYVGIDGDSVSNYGADVLSLDEDKNELYVVRYGSRRTANELGNRIGIDENGFNFISNPLKL